VVGVISIPHSGTHIPPSVTGFLTQDAAAMARDIDPEVHCIIDIEKLNRNGFSVIKTNVHRSIVDLNRPTSTAISYWRKNTAGETLYEIDIPEEQKGILLEKFYAPYFEKIFLEMGRLAEKKSRPLFFDLHSTPSQFPKYYLTKLPQLAGTIPDFCLSNLEGKSSSRETIIGLKDSLRKHFREVRINDPFKGGNITQTVHAKFPRAEVIQVEILRRLYMKEEVNALNHEKTEKLKRIFTDALIASNHA